jgi:hypothetical protein
MEMVKEKLLFNIVSSVSKILVFGTMFWTASSMKSLFFYWNESWQGWFEGNFFNMRYNMVIGALATSKYFPWMKIIVHKPWKLCIFIQ